MNRIEAKRIIALIWIIVFLGRWVFHLVAFGPLLQDSEFDQALERGQQIGILEIDDVRESPFHFITRQDAARRYVAYAQFTDMPLYSDDICEFNDIDGLREKEREIVMLSCRYRFFRWSKWWYYPESYLTKSGSIVALMKWLYPTRDRWETEPYRDPFVLQAYELGITLRRSDPYMMYLVSRYELLLQLYRASK